MFAFISKNDNGAYNVKIVDNDKNVVCDKSFSYSLGDDVVDLGYDGFVFDACSVYNPNTKKYLDVVISKDAIFQVSSEDLSDFFLFFYDAIYLGPNYTSVELNDGFCHFVNENETFSSFDLRIDDSFISVSNINFNGNDCFGGIYAFNGTSVIELDKNISFDEYIKSISDSSSFDICCQDILDSITLADSKIQDILERVVSLSSLISKLNTIETKIDSLDVDLSSVISKFNSIETKLDNVDVDLSSVTTKLDNIDTKFNMIEFFKISEVIDEKISQLFAMKSLNGSNGSKFEDGAVVTVKGYNGNWVVEGSYPMLNADNVVMVIYKLKQDDRFLIAPAPFLERV